MGCVDVVINRAYSLCRMMVSDDPSVWLVNKSEWTNCQASNARKKTAVPCGLKSHHRSDQRATQYSVPVRGLE